MLHAQSTATAYGPSPVPTAPSTVVTLRHSHTGSTCQSGPGGVGALTPGQRRFSGALGATCAAGAALTDPAVNARMLANTPTAREATRMLKDMRPTMHHQAVLRAPQMHQNCFACTTPPTRTPARSAGAW